MILTSLPSASRTQKPTTLVSDASGPCVVQMIPSTVQHRDSEGENAQLVTAMQSLVMDQRHPLALEITGTARERRFLIRAGNPAALAHAETQLRARFPYAAFVPCAPPDDPLCLTERETGSVVELRAGRASYFPLQIFEKAQGSEDPILGIFGALDALPAGMRAVAQLALIPARPTWSTRYQRKAVEHALDPERQQERWKMASARESAGAPSGLFLFLGALTLGGGVMLQDNPRLLPSWLPGVFAALAHGHWHQVWDGPHRAGVLMLLAGVVGIGMGAVMIRRFVGPVFGRSALYDMRQVAEKTSRSAYRVSLCLYVISPRVMFPSRASVLGEAAHSGKQRWGSWGSRIGVLGGMAWMLIQGWGGLLVQRQWKQAMTVFWLVCVLLATRTWGRCRVIGTAVRVAFVCCWEYGSACQQARRQRRAILAHLIAAYRQYHLASGNFFVPRSLVRQRKALKPGAWQQRVTRSRHVIDVNAVAALWHMPGAEALPGLAQVAYVQQRTRLLPLALQQAQAHVRGQEMPLGHSVHAGHTLPFRLPADCLRSHFLIAGKSGEGKSTLITHMAWDAMRGGGGLVLIDPHGDLAEDVLRLVPPERRDDVVLIDLSDEQFACGINPLDATMARGRDKIISDLIKVLSKYWAATWGSRMEIAFEYAMRTLYEANKVLVRQGRAAHQYTLLDVISVLTDASFCHRLLEDIHDPYILRWWAIYFDPLSLQMQRDRVDPVLSKVAKFEGTIARHIVGQSQTTIDFSACIAEGKILLVKLAKGMVGDDVAHILGATVLGGLHVAFEEQGSKEARERKRLPIFIDEFQTLEGVDWGALAELRKYGATFCLATQSLDYLQQKNVLSVVLANVKQMAIFRLSAEDARLLHRDLDVEPEDILHLHSLDCYLKLTYQQRQYPAFSLTLCFPPTGDAAHAQIIREQVRRRYMRPVSSIDAELFDHLARQLGAMPTSAGGKRGAQSSPAPTDTTKKGLARQDGGNRGRKSQQQKAQAPNAKTDPVSPPELTKMNWTETMGPMTDATSKDDEQEAEKGTEGDA